MTVSDGARLVAQRGTSRLGPL